MELKFESRKLSSKAQWGLKIYNDQKEVFPHFLFFFLIATRHNTMAIPKFQQYEMFLFVQFSRSTELLPQKVRIFVREPDILRDDVYVYELQSF